MSKISVISYLPQSINFTIHNEVSKDLDALTSEEKKAYLHTSRRKSRKSIVINGTNELVKKYGTQKALDHPAETLIEKDDWDFIEKHYGHSSIFKNKQILLNDKNAESKAKDRIKGKMSFAEPTDLNNVKPDVV